MLNHITQKWSLTLFRKCGKCFWHPWMEIQSLIVSLLRKNILVWSVWVCLLIHEFCICKCPNLSVQWHRHRNTNAEDFYANLASTLIMFKNIKFRGTDQKASSLEEFTQFLKGKCMTRPCNFHNLPFATISCPIS